MAYDPIGPGTPAWNSFDNALEAYARVPDGQHNATSRDYKRYANYRDYMIRCLKRDGVDRATIREWTDLLIERAKARDFDD